MFCKLSRIYRLEKEKTNSDVIVVKYSLNNFFANNYHNANK